MMRKSLVLVLITLLMIGVFMVSCNSEVTGTSSGGDKLVNVSIAGNTKGISAVGTADNPDDYVWYYKASKNDNSVYRTGETIALDSTTGNCGNGGWKPVKSNYAPGLVGESLGNFSTGLWKFSFIGFRTAKDWGTESSDVEKVREHGATTGAFADPEPVYYQYNLSVNVTENTFVTVTLEDGADLSNAILVFPSGDDALNWKYTVDANSGDVAATLTALATHKAYMVVSYQSFDGNSYSDAVRLARAESSSTISTDSDNKTAEVSFSDFHPFKIDGSVDTTSDKVTLESSRTGKAYRLLFEVYLNDNNEEGQKLGNTSTQSITAYLGGVIRVSKVGSNAVDDNEQQFNVTVQYAAKKESETKASATLAAQTTATTQVVSSPVTAVKNEEQTADKNSNVIFPTGSLKTSDSSSEYTQIVTVEVVTNETENEETDTFTITEGTIDEGSYIAGISVTAEQITTVTSELGSSSSSGSLTSFEDGSYVAITTYLDKHLGHVSISAEAGKAAPIFASEGTPNASLIDNTSSDAGTGYNSETGLLIFKTNHFSKFYASGEAQLVKTKVAGVETVYYASDIMTAHPQTSDHNTSEWDCVDEWVVSAFTNSEDNKGKTIEVTFMKDIVVNRTAETQACGWGAGYTFNYSRSMSAGDARFDSIEDADRPTIILDLNGHSVSFILGDSYDNPLNLPFFVFNCNMVIKDSSEEGTGAIISSAKLGTFGLYGNSCVTIEGGNIVNLNPDESNLYPIPFHVSIGTVLDSNNNSVDNTSSVITGGTFVSKNPSDITTSSGLAEGYRCMAITSPYEGFTASKVVPNYY